MQAIGRQLQRATDGASVNYDSHRAEQTTLYRIVQQRAGSFIAHTEASTGTDLPQLVKGEFDAFLECGILALGFLRLHCGDCGTTSSSRSAASDAGSAPRAVPGAWRSRPPPASVSSR